MNIGVVCYLMIFTKDQIFQNNGGKNYFLVRFPFYLDLGVNGPLRQEKLSHVDIFRSAEPFVEKNLLQLRISYSAKYDCLYFM